MDLRTMRAAARVHEFQEGTSSSTEMEERLARLHELSSDEKKKLMADAFSRALDIAEELITRPEYEAEEHTLDLSAHGLGKIRLDVYNHNVEAAEVLHEDDKPFDGIVVDPGEVYSQHQVIGELKDEMVYVNRDGTIPDSMDDLDHLVHATLEYLESLEVIQRQLAPTAVTT